MQRLLALLVLVLIINPIQAQNSFSFNCTKDTSISCTAQCITLKATIPDIYSSTSSYVVNRFSNGTCFRGYVSPASPGPTANLTIDDRYSPIIDITFPFSFYGSTYTKLSASTNGFLTFDVSKAQTISHYGILANGAFLSSTVGTPQDLPSTLYDGAIIMAPYHDLDPNNGSATQQIKYDVVGTAPYRKWILSYYDVPLYTTACLNLALNTHQIVLYETLGIVEVFIYDKEICPNWNMGRAMIGMQNMGGTSAIMAPGRQATSAPWGIQDMNESWRFTPAGGSSLFDRVELYTLSGTFIAKGITAALPNNLLDVSFSNVCPPQTGESYVVKSYYKNPNGSGEIIGTDTINVFKGEIIEASIVSAGCGAGNSGTITITSPGGPSYEYSMDGSAWQSSNFFTATAGVHTIRARLIGAPCISNKSFTVTNASLSASISTVPTQCTGSPTGSITINPANGNAPYIYSIDNGATFQNSNVFQNLPAGNYDVVIRDAAGCSYTRLAIIGTEGPSFTVDIIKPVCGGSLTGTITVNATGSGPFTYAINVNPKQSSNVFNNITTGTHTIFVYDAGGCSSGLNVLVTSDVIINATATIKMPTCFGGNDGGIVANPSDGTAPYQFALETNPYQNANTFNNLDSGNYILHVKDSRGCIKDTLVTVLEPNAFKITAITTKATSCASLDGQITIKANGGTTPYLYSVYNGNNYSVNSTFTVKSGNYSLMVKDNNGCLTNGTATVEAINNNLTLELGQDRTMCAEDSISIIPVTSPPADYFRWSLASGLSDTTSGSPKASPADTITYFLTARTGFCERYDSITINVLRKPIADAGTDSVICYNTSAKLNGSATNLSGTVNYLWSPASEITNPNSPSTIVTPKNSRLNIYVLRVSDNYGCNFKVYDQVKITMLPPVAAFAGNDTVATNGVPHQLIGSGGGAYLWTPSNVLDDPSKPNPTATLYNDTKFTLLVTDSLGCYNSSTVTVKVYKGATYYIPNAFTPNGDGLNDVFRAIAPGIQLTEYFRIFNRWGKLLYQARDARKGWDGTYLGEPQPSAVYVWIIKGIDVKQNIIELKGTVTLIR